MRTLIFTVFTFLLGAAAWGQDQYAARDDMSSSTVAESKEVSRGYLRDEVVSVKPHLGVIAFSDALGGDTSRALGGLSVDMNMASTIDKEWKDFYVGPSTGAYYSHLGSTTSNFFGTNPDLAITDPGANFLLIPVNLKVGYTFMDNFRIAAHGGGNVIYRSVASSLFLGDSSFEAGSTWKMFPSVGGDMEFGLGKNVSLSLRPDVTITPGNELFVGTLGLGVLLG